MTVLKVMLSFQMLSFGLILIVILLIKWWRQKPLRDFTSKVPGLNKLPFIGSAYKLIGVAPEDIYETIAGWTKIYKSDFTYWLGSYMVLHIFDPKDIKTVLNSQSCNDKPEIFYHSYFKHGLFLENGEKHRTQRKTVNPAFNPTALRFYNPIINKNVTKFLETFEEHVEMSKVVDFKLLSQDFALETVVETMFGVDDIDREDRMNLVKGVDE